MYIMGIYKITNSVNGKLYIGSSKDINKRWKKHFSDLKNNKHHSKYLQNAWNKYGEDNFRFEVVELVNDEELLFNAEQKWLNKTNSFNGEYGYNMSMDATRPSKNNPYVNTHLEANFVFRESINCLVSMKLEVNEKLVYYVLRDFIAYPSNSVMINEQIPSFVELEVIVGIKERTIRKALKSLEIKGLIKLVQSGHKKAIYVNPAYYASGKELNIDVLEMFELVECDNRKVDAYL